MKRILIYLALLVVASMLPAAASAQMLTWHTDQTIYSNSFDAGSPSVAISGDNAVAVWKRSDGSHDRIYASRSTNKGQTWSTPVSVDYNTLNAQEPQVAISGSNVVVVFSQYDGDEYRIYANYSANAGANWVGARLIEDNGASSSSALLTEDKPSDIDPRNAYEPQVAISGSNVVVIWKQYDGSHDRIYANYSTNGGASWGTDILLDQRAYAAQSPRLAMSENNVVAIWSQSDGSYVSIYTRYSSNAGATWAGSDAVIEAQTTDAYSPRVAVSGNNVVAVWVAYPAGLGRIYANRAAFSGGVLTWTPTNTQLIENNDTIDQDTPQVAISGSNVVAVWNGYPGGTYRIYTSYSANAGTSWEADQFLQTADVDAGNPQVAISGSNVMAIWSQEESVNRIYSRHSFNGGEDWEDPELIEDNAGANAHSPQLAVSGNDVVSVWIQENGGYYAVFANYAAFSSGGFIGPGGSGGGGGGCFIATAAFGTPLAKQVEVLRQFRDKYLLTNAPGRSFVAWYYRNGPVAARFIEGRPLARAAAQAGLYPLIGFSFLLINGWLPFVLAGLLLAALIFFRFRSGKVSAG